MFSLIVPFLNGEIWLPFFLEYYLKILAPTDQLVLVEGATSFHSPGEQKHGLSTDESQKIIEGYKSYENLKYLRKGRVHVITDLLALGYDASRSYDYIGILSIYDYAPSSLFDEISGDYVSYKRVELIGDFRHQRAKAGEYGHIFKNIDGIYFRDGLKYPFLADRELHQHVGVKFGKSRVINVEGIETKKQALMRLLTKYRHQKWFYHNISQQAPRIDDEQKACMEEMRRLHTEENISTDRETNQFVDEVFKEHKWKSLSANEIYHLPYLFGTKSRAPRVFGKRFLAIGCGTGDFLKAIGEMGWEAKGIEESKWNYRYAKYIEGLNVSNETIESFEADTDYDAVLFGDELTDAALSKIFKILKPDGVLILRGLYDETQLHQFLERNGFRVVWKEINEERTICGASKQGKRYSSKGTTAFMRLDGLGGTMTLSDQAKKFFDETGQKVTLITRGYEVLFEKNPFVKEIINVGMRDWRECSIAMRSEFELGEIRFGLGKWHNSDRQNYSEFSAIFEQFPKDYNQLESYGLHHIQLTDKTLGFAYDTIESKIFVDESFPLEQDFILINNGVDVIHRGMRQTKCWDDRYWEEFVNGVGHPVAQVGTPFDQPVEGTIDLRGKTSLQQVIYLLKKAKATVIAEGGLMHLAFAAGANNVFVLGGPTQGPLFEYPGHHWITAYFCGNCWGSTDDWYEICPKQVNAVCMQMISPQRVIERVNQLL